MLCIPSVEVILHIATRNRENVEIMGCVPYKGLCMGVSLTLYIREAMWTSLQVTLALSVLSVASCELQVARSDGKVGFPV